MSRDGSLYHKNCYEVARESQDSVVSEVCRVSPGRGGVSGEMATQAGKETGVRLVMFPNS